jgi:ribosomal-protein-alanine N-acetyltransferase
MNEEWERPFVLAGERVSVRLPEPEDVDAIIRFFTENEAHLEPFGAAYARELLTPQHWLGQIEKRRIEFLHDDSCKTFIYRNDDGSVVGSASLSEIVRGQFQAAYLGYALALREQGKGMMSEALRLLISFAFAEMNLHRIMANFLPGNRRSRAVLERLGFAIEGDAKDYLRINGAWQAHVLTSLTNPDWRS